MRAILISAVLVGGCGGQTSEQGAGSSETQTKEQRAAESKESARLVYKLYLENRKELRAEARKLHERTGPDEASQKAASTELNKIQNKHAKILFDLNISKCPADFQEAFEKILLEIREGRDLRELEFSLARIAKRLGIAD